MKKLLLSALMLSAGAAFAQWTPQATGFTTPSRGVSQIDIVDANTVWAVAYDGSAANEDITEITKTVDGGATWTPKFVDLGNEELNINNIQGIDADVAWISAIFDIGGVLYKTNDGGDIWEPSNPIIVGQATPSFEYSTSFQNVVHFFDDMTGIVQGDPVAVGPIYDFEIYRTTDGGNEWTRLAAAPLPNALNGDEWGYNGGNVFSGDSFWFVTNAGRIYRSGDKGATWAVSQSPFSDFGSAAINAQLMMSDINNNVNTAIGVLIGTTNSGTSYTRYTTADGGATWTNQGAYTFAYLNMEFIPQTNMLVATGNNGEVFTTAYSTDLGATWTEISADDVQRTSIAFLDGTTGWSGGFNLDDTEGGIFKYTGPSLAIPTVANRSQFTATPNPTNGMMQVANDNANITEVVVYDLLGKQVYNGKFSALTEVNLDLTPLTAGAYILTATADNGAKQTIKIMKN